MLWWCNLCRVRHILSLQSSTWFGTVQPANLGPSLLLLQCLQQTRCAMRNVCWVEHERAGCGCVDSKGQQTPKGLVSVLSAAACLLVC